MSAGMVPFVRFFPQQGTAETRVLTTQGHPVLPDDEYALLEFFCADPGCDCRRVMLGVIGRRQQDVLASISYGFDRGQQWAGPFLDPLNPQSLYAHTVLKLVAQVLADPTYAARLESHYYGVKRVTAALAHATHQMPARHTKANKTKPQRQAGPRKKRK
jgi:hypothetical protein